MVCVKHVGWANVSHIPNVRPFKVEIQSIGVSTAAIGAMLMHNKNLHENPVSTSMRSYERGSCTRLLFCPSLVLKYGGMILFECGMCPRGDMHSLADDVSDSVSATLSSHQQEVADMRDWLHKFHGAVSAHATALHTGENATSYSEVTLAAMAACVFSGQTA